MKFNTDILTADKKKGDGINAILGLMKDIRDFSDKIEVCAEAQAMADNKNKIAEFKRESRINLSNQLIFKCYKFFYEKLRTNTKGMDNKERKDYLHEITRSVLRKFVVITTEVTDIHTAYSIFQTINETISGNSAYHLFVKNRAKTFST